MTRMLNKFSIPSWAKQQFLYSKPSQVLSLSVFIFGTLVRIENFVPEKYTFLIHDNLILSLISCGAILISNSQILYLSSLVFLIGTILFGRLIPREVKISEKRSDYVERALNQINDSNVIRWSKKYVSDVPENAPEDFVMIAEKVNTYLEYCEANIKIGNVIAIDSGFRSTIEHAIQLKYDYINQQSNKRARVTTFVIWFFATGLASFAGIDTIVRTISVIFSANA